MYALVHIYVVCASMVYGHRGRMFGKKTETRAVRRDMPFVYVGGACTYQHRRLEVVSRRVRDREHTAAHGNVGAARVGGRGPAGSMVFGHESSEKVGGETPSLP